MSADPDNILQMFYMQPALLHNNQSTIQTLSSVPALSQIKLAWKEMQKHSALQAGFEEAKSADSN